MLWDWYYRFLDWIEDEPEGRKLFVSIAKYTGTIFLYSVAVVLVVETLQYLYHEPVSLPRNVDENDLASIWFPLTLAGDVLFEELIFRLPLALAIKRWGVSWKLWSAVVISSVLFGLFHGSPWCILIQGMHGSLLALAFVKCGGLSHNWKKALFASFAVHLCYDGFLFSLVGIP